MASSVRLLHAVLCGDEHGREGPVARKKINAPIYTRGRYGRGWWDTVDTDNDYLYSWCRYPTKITEADLPEDYIKIRSRVTR